MTSSKTRAPGARSCANGRRCIRSSAGCRASSRSPSQARPRTAPPPPSTTSACASCAGRRASNGFRVLVGGGMGRTPYVGQEIRPFLEKEHLLSYIESILRVYNLHGRRDNINKARIKILVNQLGIDKFREDVEADWEATRKDAVDLPASEYARINSYFAPPDLVPGPDQRRGRRAAAHHRSRLRQLAQAQCQAASRAWLCERGHLAERAWPHARRRKLGPDGFRCRSRRALQPERGAGELHAEPHPAARRAQPTCSPSMTSSNPRGSPPAITISWAT